MGSLDFRGIFYITVDALIIESIYALTVFYYRALIKYTTDEINKYLETKNKLD